uniref:CAP domain-containing protein n=1 Tax=Catenulispora pinisilvae TaxID=2705253 RepID=UPI001891C639
VAPPPTSTTSTPAPFNAAAAVSAALGEIGAARNQEGVSAPSVDRLLTKAAALHSTDMARTGDFSHIGSDGSDPFSRAAGVGCLTLSQELIAHGKPGDDVVGALLRDPASRRALVSFWNTGIGVSAQLDPTTGDVYWTIELGWL